MIIAAIYSTIEILFGLIPLNVVCAKLSNDFPAISRNDELSSINKWIFGLAHQVIIVFVQMVTSVMYRYTIDAHHQAGKPREINAEGEIRFYFQSYVLSFKMDEGISQQVFQVLHVHIVHIADSNAIVWKVLLQNYGKNYGVYCVRLPFVINNFDPYLCG